MKNFPDKKLVEGALGGDPKCQSALYHRYESRMYAISLRYANDQPMALDILQEGFVRVFKGLHTYKGTAPLVKWMDRVMANTAIRYISKNKRFSYREDEHLELLKGGNNDIQSYTDKGDLIEIIGRLPIKHRTVFNMFAVEGYSHKEIGKKLGITDVASRSIYFRAKKTLQELLRTNEMI